MEKSTNLHSRSEKMTNGQEKHESLGKKGIGVKLELFPERGKTGVITIATEGNRSNDSIQIIGDRASNGFALPFLLRSIYTSNISVCSRFLPNTPFFPRFFKITLDQFSIEG